MDRFHKRTLDCLAGLRNNCTSSLLFQHKHMQIFHGQIYLFVDAFQVVCNGGGVGNVTERVCATFSPLFVIVSARTGSITHRKDRWVAAEFQSAVRSREGHFAGEGREERIQTGDTLV